MLFEDGDIFSISVAIREVISPSDVCNGILRPIPATLPRDPLLGRDRTHSVTRVSGFPGDLAIGFVVPTRQYSPIRL